MHLFIASAQIAVGIFVLDLVYFHVIFRSVVKATEKNHSKDVLLNKLMLLFCYFIVALVYGTFGFTINLFNTASFEMPYIIAVFFWLMISAVILIDSLKSNQSRILAFLNIIFWLIALLGFAVYFPYLSDWIS